MKAKRVGANFAINLLNTIVTFALGIIIPRLFLVTLGSETNGLVSSVSQVFTYVGLLEAGKKGNTEEINKFYELVGN